MSKPMGPIPAGFAADADCVLLIGGRRADELVREAGRLPMFKPEISAMTVESQK